MKQLIKKTLVVSFLSLFFIGCSKSDDSDSPNEESAKIFSLQAGNYTGLWNSTTPSATFTNLPISARIVETSSGNFDGEFFISGNFVSCCNSGANDGAISFSIDENDLSSFRWDDIIPNCTGTFTGNGKLTNENAFNVSFTGTDCDGSHTGTIRLSKV